MPSRRRGHRRSVRARPLTAAFLLLGACATTTDLVPHCCYTGEAALARIEDVKLVTADGRKMAFDEVYSGFAPQSGVFTKPFPFREVDIAQVTYQALVPVLPLYDANGDDRIQEPELTALFIREGALGLGHDVDHLEVDGERADAITVARADVGGLVSYLSDRLDSLSEESQQVFRDLDRVGLDIRQRGSEGADRDFGQEPILP